jgi:ribonuclease Z
MSGRDVVLLGTASQVPTTTRAHHATLLRFDGHGILFDPGEGTQRQLAFAGIPASRIDRICITHAHGDHLLGLPGVLQRLSLDNVDHAIDVHFPTEVRPYVEGLRHGSAYLDELDVRLHPTGPGRVLTEPPLFLRAAELSHALPTLGWRVDEPPGWSLDPARAAAAGIEGEDRAELLETGSVRVRGRTIHVEQIAHEKRPRSFAFVMDTRECDGARELAERADLLVIEATFLETERDIAEHAGHLTAAQAVRLAADAGVGRVVLTHLSRRYPGIAGHEAEARAAAPGLDVHVAQDLDVVGFPPRDERRAAR